MLAALLLLHAWVSPHSGFGHQPWARKQAPQASATLGTDLQNWKLMKRDDSGDGGFLLDAANAELEAKEVFVEIPRSESNPSLGILLDEIFGNDDAGVVIVEGLVEGGNGEKASVPLLPGDALVAAGVPGGPFTRIEGLNFDDTVGVLGSLDVGAGKVVLGVKRLAKRPAVKLTIRFPQSEGRDDEVLKLYKGNNLRRTIMARGVKLNDPLARRFDAGIGTGDCGGEGCCCTCAMEIESGSELLNPQKTQEEQMLRRFPRWRLGCKAYIEDLEEDKEMVVKVRPHPSDRS